MGFLQDPPQLGNQLDDDALLQEWLARSLPPELLAQHLDELRALGELAGGELYRAQLEDRQNEPRLIHFDAWGRRIDHIELTRVWQRARELSATHGLVARAYDTSLGVHARTLQFALNHVVQPSLDVYSCPLAMSDGAAKTLSRATDAQVRGRALSHLLARNPDEVWTSGQWMTERTGGSDVGRTETVARLDPATGKHRLWGTKWFTSATSSEMALTLARPEGQAAGSRGLALFYVETRDEGGRTRPEIELHRLKDKLGTRKLPTAELSLHGAEAIAVAGLEHGVRNIAPMLNVTRTWNAAAACFGMRRALALVQDYATRREAFGALLARKPLYADSVAALVAEYEASFVLSYRTIEVLGCEERGEATEDQLALLRVLTPLTKLTTARAAVFVASQALECFGGAGYVEDTLLPRLLADAQVLPIWEGTTDVLSLDMLRAFADPAALPALLGECARAAAGVRAPELLPALARARATLSKLAGFVSTLSEDRPLAESHARRVALSFGRSLALSLLCEHAQWCLDHGRGKRSLAAARRFAFAGVDLLGEAEDLRPTLEESARLMAARGVTPR